MDFIGKEHSVMGSGKWVLLLLLLVVVVVHEFSKASPPLAATWSPAIRICVQISKKF